MSAVSLYLPLNTQCAIIPNLFQDIILSLIDTQMNRSLQTLSYPLMLLTDIDINFNFLKIICKCFPNRITLLRFRLCLALDANFLFY